MILIIDDDSAVLASLNLFLKQEGFKVVLASSPDQGFHQLESNKVKLILLDMNFSSSTSGEEGLNTLRIIRQRTPQIPVILITGWATVPLAVEGMKLGASDFVSKPWDNQFLVQSIKTLLSLNNFRSETSQTRAELDKKYQFDQIIGEASSFLKVLETVGRISSTDASVLIYGESGTGKELIAEAIHRNSNRNNMPFVKVNLGGISSSLFESEMFGHKKGAFTDALFDRKGRFEIADGGTIFLDEIGELDLNCQVKLLRVLQDRTYEVLGDSHTRKVNVRVVCATNQPLEKMIDSKQFREDLFYRINLISIKIPPIRERSSDIPLLTNHFLVNLKRAYGYKSLEATRDALDWLQTLPLFGNVRELKNLVERTVLMNNKEILVTDDFSAQLQRVTPNKTISDLSTNLTIEKMEELLIRQSIELHNHNMSKVAKVLGLSRGALYRRLDKYGIPYDIQN